MERPPISEKELYDFKIQNPFIVLDASPLISGMDLSLFAENCFTTPEIISEIKNKHVQQKLESFMQLRKLRVISPPDYYTSQVNKKSKTSGDLKFLSTNDASVIALALYLQDSYSFKFDIERDEVPLKIYSDDYSLQNVARLFSFIAEPFKHIGIKKYIDWELYCPACYAVYDSDYKMSNCDVCDTPIKRRPKKQGNKKK